MNHKQSLASHWKVGILGGAIAIVALFFGLFDIIVQNGSAEAVAKIAERSQSE